MKNVIIIKYGEISLKGRNRGKFESFLKRNIHRATDIKENLIYSRYGRIYINTSNLQTSQIFEQLQSKLKKIFGIVSFSFGILLPANSSLDEIKSIVIQQFQHQLHGIKTFKIDTRRPTKTFPHDSNFMNCELGACVLQEFPQLKVKLDNPEFILFVEIRDEGVVLYSNINSYPGPGGLPVDASGNGLLLLSGGIDSPVAGWMMMKRGMPLDAIHFHSFPFTGQRSKEKVVDLVKSLREWKINPIHLFIPHFTNVQVEINKSCPQSLWTVLHRRMMMRITQKIALKNRNNVEYQTIITGENVGQVASQTIENISIINKIVDLPVIRPLIGFDKADIIKLAQGIDTFRISILPYDDCCTLFSPRNPETKARENEVLEAETKIDIHSLIEESIEKMEVLQI